MISRNNHYLSQMYLKNWAKDRKVQVYSILVPDERVPLWIPRGTAGVGSYDSMFVRFDNGEETDDIEKWFATDYEDPAKKSLDKAVAGEDLTEEDWYYLIELLACHIVRSPKYLAKSLQIQVDAIENALIDLQETLPKLTKEDIKNYVSKYPEDDHRVQIPLKITEQESDSETTLLKIETMVGKQTYLWGMEHLLKNATYVLHQHNWSVVTVEDSITLPTTDNPVVFVNFENASNYNLEGSWDTPDTRIIFPISPKKFIYCQVGRTIEPKQTINRINSEWIKKFILENAYKTIISEEPDPDVPKIRPRCVSKEVYLEEKEKWENFQKNYIEEETKYIRS